MHSPLADFVKCRCANPSLTLAKSYFIVCLCNLMLNFIEKLILFIA